MTNKGKVGTIIHSAATSAAAVGAGLAQIPCSDNAIITPIQVAMIMAIGKAVGRELDLAAAIATLSAASAGIIGRTIAQILVGWIPGYGNALNASTAFGVTQAIGWAAYGILYEEAA
jgi:uncharacterized protein (DUF697 family)